MNSAFHLPLLIWYQASITSVLDRKTFDKSLGTNIWKKDKYVFYENTNKSASQVVVLGKVGAAGREDITRHIVTSAHLQRQAVVYTSHCLNIGTFFKHICVYCTTGHIIVVTSCYFQKHVFVRTHCNVESAQCKFGARFRRWGRWGHRPQALGWAQDPPSSKPAAHMLLLSTIILQAAAHMLLLLLSKIILQASLNCTVPSSGVSPSALSNFQLNSKLCRIWARSKVQSCLISRVGLLSPALQCSPFKPPLDTTTTVHTTSNQRQTGLRARFQQCKPSTKMKKWHEIDTSLATVVAAPKLNSTQRHLTQLST